MYPDAPSTILGSWFLLVLGLGTVLGSWFRCRSSVRFHGSWVRFLCSSLGLIVYKKIWIFPGNIFDIQLKLDYLKRTNVTSKPAI